MRTRSGRQIQPLIKKEKKKKERKHDIIFLTCGMIRNSDDNSPHICVFCRKRFNLKASHNLLQCPTCKDVYHLQCMLDFIRKSSNDTIGCPCCREIVPVETNDEYISTEVLEKEWYFDFKDIVENQTDKEFRANDKVKENSGVDSKNCSEEDSEEGSEYSSEYSSEDSNGLNSEDSDSDDDT